MAAPAENSFNDIIGLFSGGGLASTNFGFIALGTYYNHIPEDDKNMIGDRGTVLINGDYGESWDFNIEFDYGKVIHVKIDKTGTGYQGQVEFLQDGEVYAYEGTTLAGSSGYFNYDLASEGQRLAWLDPEGYFVSLCYSQDVNSGDLDIALVMAPMMYNVGTEYPLDIWVAVSDHSKIAPLIVNLVSDYGLDHNTKTEYYTAQYHFFEDISIVDISYEDGDVSPSGGGGGTYVGRNDAMDFSPLPTLSATSTGLCSIYAPTVSQMHAIANWLWSDDFFDNIIKNFASPFDNIIGLYVSPVVPPSVASNFIVGNVNSQINVNKVGAGYIARNCGSISVAPYYNSFADYDNYRSYKIFLPYYGIVDLSTDDFMNGMISVQYNVDTFSGACTIQVRTTRAGVPHILHSYSSNLYSPIPFSGVNMMPFFSNMMNASASIVTQGIAGNPIGMTSGITGLISAHPTYGGSKGVSNTGGLMGIQRPYLIECRSIRDMPEKYNQVEGIPLNKYKRVASLSGFTQFEAIRVRANGATKEELTEIENILKEGVIL